MLIFHSYVSLPEGKPPFSYGFPMVFPLKTLFHGPSLALEAGADCRARSRHRTFGEPRGTGSGEVSREQ